MGGDGFTPEQIKEAEADFERRLGVNLQGEAGHMSRGHNAAACLRLPRLHGTVLADHVLPPLSPAAQPSRAAAALATSRRARGRCMCCRCTRCWHLGCRCASLALLQGVRNSTSLKLLADVQAMVIKDCVMLAAAVHGEAF